MRDEQFLDVNVVHFGGEAVGAAGVKCSVMVCWCKWTLELESDSPCVYRCVIADCLNRFNVRAHDLTASFNEVVFGFMFDPVKPSIVCRSKNI